jgi:membrane-associated phospholipid phosphatase
MSVEQAVAKKPPRQVVAAAISAIVHPVALPLMTLVAVTYSVTGQLRQGLALAGVALLLTTAPVAALVSFQVARGRWTDLDVSVREQRYLLYPIALICAALMIGVFALMRAPIPAMVTALTLTLANTVNGFINFAYKVSGHATTAAACAALLWLYTPGWGVPFAIAAALVGWSRVELGRHTSGQVLLGWAVGAVSGLAIYSFYSIPFI